MGSPIAQVAQSTQPQPQTQGKGFQSIAQSDQSSNLPGFAPPNAAGQTQGKGSNVTIPGQDGQPKLGMPNNYPNTIRQWDNATIGTQQYSPMFGKSGAPQNSSQSGKTNARRGKGA
jgi:hypothetical protein